jgi:rubredoxin
MSGVVCPAWPGTAQADHDLGASLRAVKWMCESCGFIYDPTQGDPDGGIPPGTAFEDIPETWFCPVCGARKQDFTPYEG